MLSASGPITNTSWAVGAALTAGAAAFAGLAYATFVPRSRLWGDVICRGPDANSNHIALTFDDGPTPPFTAQILDELAALNVKATFFVIGVNAIKNPELVQRAYAEGHAIANHSLDHIHFGVMRAGRYWQRQIGQTNQIIGNIIGRRPSMFRPPMGIKTWHITAAARRNGNTLVNWTRRGFDGVRTTPDRIESRLVDHTRGGEILLLHDGIEPHGHSTPAATVQAIRPIVTALRNRGLDFVRLDELLKIPAYQT